MARNKEIKTRKVYRRRVFLSILYSILSFGIYLMFWQYEIAKETSGITKNEKGTKPGLVVFFTIITLGIYGVYWSFQIGKKQDNYFSYNIQKNTQKKAKYLVFAIINYIIPVFNLVNLATMQGNNNKMLNIYEEQNKTKPEVRDNAVWNKPILGTIALFAIAFGVPQILNEIFMQVISGFAAGETMQAIFNGVTKPDTLASAENILNANAPINICACISMIVSTLIILWWYKLRFKNSEYSYRGVLGRDGFRISLLFALPLLSVVTLDIVFGVNINNFKFGLILLGFVPGFTEEIAFRGLLIPNFMRIINGKKSIWIALFVPAGFFGLVHGSNLLAGASFSMSLYQVIDTAVFGIILGGIFLRSGNLWPCILVHGIHDFLCFMQDQALESGGVLTMEFTFDPLMLIEWAVYVALAIYAIWLCRPSKHDEIRQTWNNKWGIK